MPVPARRLVVLAAAAVVAVAVAAPVSLARFTSSSDAAGRFATGTIAPPTGLAASAGTTAVTLTWTPTTSTVVTGYDVLRSATSGSGYAVVSSVTPRTATTTTNSPGNGTFYYVLQSVFLNWRSGSSNEVSATIGATTTALMGCASNAADTGGDGNGFETTPGNGCAVDGSMAVDASSGTNTVVSCANAGKDRHRYWGYAFGLPPTVSAVKGITVSVDAGLNNNGGTTVTCVELSWDGGTTWTTPKQLTYGGSATATYTLGGATDTWGRTWSASQLGSTSFRVRLTNATSQPNKDFRLDAVRLAVSYSP